MIKELVFSGGGSRGIVFLGVLKELERNNLLDDIEFFYCSSISSLVCILYIIGYKIDDLIDIIIELDTKILKKNFNYREFFKNGFVSDGEDFYQFVFNLIEKFINPNCKLSEIKKKFGKDILFTVTSLDNGLKIFSTELTPNENLYQILTCCMCFPIVFKNRIIKGERFIDGGVLNNFPFQYLKYNDETSLGIKLVGNNTNLENFNYILDIINLVYNRSCNSFGNIEDCKSCILNIYVHDFPVLNFEMELDDKITLLKRGKNEIKNWIIKKKMDELVESIVRKK
jgi:NTE family protein